MGTIRYVVLIFCIFSEIRLLGITYLFANGQYSLPTLITKVSHLAMSMLVVPWLVFSQSELMLVNNCVDDNDNSLFFHIRKVTLNTVEHSFRLPNDGHCMLWWCWWWWHWNFTGSLQFLCR